MKQQGNACLRGSTSGPRARRGPGACTWYLSPVQSWLYPSWEQTLRNTLKRHIFFILHLIFKSSPKSLSNPSDSRAYWYKSVTNSWDFRKVVRGGSSYISPTGKLRTFWAFSECFYHLLRIRSNLRNSELDRSSVQDILKLIPSFMGVH